MGHTEIFRFHIATCPFSPIILFTVGDQFANAPCLRVLTSAFGTQHSQTTNINTGISYITLGCVQQGLTSSRTPNTLSCYLLLLRLLLLLLSAECWCCGRISTAGQHTISQGVSDAGPRLPLHPVRHRPAACICISLLLLRLLLACTPPGLLLLLCGLAGSCLAAATTAARLLLL